MLFTPIKPMLLHMGKEIKDNKDWIYDIKWDGWRILLHKDGDRVEAYTRHGNNVTTKFPELQEAGRSIQSHTAILDCEGVVLRNGISVFDNFNYRGKLTDKDKIEYATKTHPVTFIAFDILSTNHSHIKEPLLKRKERLTSIIKPSNALMVTPSIIGEGKHIFEITKEKKMEGIVGKRLSSTYQLNHRSNEWLKYKHFKLTSAIILGYKENPFTLIVGKIKKSRDLQPIASIEFGFKPEEKQAFRKISREIIKKEERGVYWLEPLLCCNVQYLEETPSHSLRIVSFKGFNFDKKPEECLLL